MQVAALLPSHPNVWFFNEKKSYKKVKYQRGMAMPGIDNITGDESISFVDNASFDGTERGGAFNADGQLWIGSISSNRANNGGHVRRNTLTQGPGIDIQNTPGTITISATGTTDTLQGGPGITLTPGGAGILIVNSVVYTDRALSTTVISDSGSFSTAAITLTLPSDPKLGERCEFIATTADVLVVTANAGQVINLGNVATGEGGTATSSAIGDSLNLIFQISTNDWWALSSVGVWTIA